MDINFNKGLSGGQGVRQEALDAFQVSRPASGTAGAPKSSAGIPARFFTITESAVSPEDVGAAGIPEVALSRDDALGRLVGEAFSLPPPPMPDFAVNP